METKYYAKIGNMYIMNVFDTSGKASLSISIKDALHLNEEEIKWVKENLNARIIKATVSYEEVE